MRKLRGRTRRTKPPLWEQFVRHLMKSGGREAAKEIFVSTMEIIRRKVPDKSVEFVVEVSVESRVLPLYIRWLLKHRATGGPVKTIEDFRAKAVAAIVKDATSYSYLTMDRRLAAAILECYPKTDPGPKGRTSAAARLSARHAYGLGG